MAFDGITIAAVAAAKKNQDPDPVIAASAAISVIIC